MVQTQWCVMEMKIYQSVMEGKYLTVLTKECTAVVCAVNNYDGGPVIAN